MSQHIQQAIDSEDDDARGLAVVIYNEKTKGQSTLPGAKSDAKKMKKAFESIGFAILTLPNKPLEKVREILAAFASYEEYPQSYNCFVVYFAGHGTQGDMLLSGDGIEFNPDVDIFKRLNRKFNPNLSNHIARAPVYVFIDACRGGKNPFRSSMRLTDRECLPRNALVAYGIGKGFAAPDSDTWTNVLAGRLSSSDKSIHDILNEVTAEMKARYKDDAVPDFIAGSTAVGAYNIRNSTDSAEKQANGDQAKIGGVGNVKADKVDVHQGGVGVLGQLVVQSGATINFGATYAAPDKNEQNGSGSDAETGAGDKGTGGKKYMGKNAPSIDDLGMLRNSKGERFQLMDKVQLHWKKIGTVIGVNVDVIGTKPDPIREVFTEWVNNASELPRSKFYPWSWDGLEEILKDSSLAEIGRQYIAFLKTIDD